jgi:arylsulfatase A-like enzyme
VLVLTVDTLRPDYMSLEGYDLPTTPRLDALLSRGTRFTRAVSPIPRTTQALASMFTGRYPSETGVRTLYDRLAPEVVPLAEIARQNGYGTIAVVSNHILTRERGLDRGFDVYDYASDIRTARATTRAAIRSLRHRRREEALFLWVHYIDPHVPYYPPPELARQFGSQYEGPYRLHFGQVQGGAGDRAYPADLPKREAVFRNKLPDEVNAHVRRLYAADIRAVDDAAHVLMTWLEKRLGDDWFVVFASDHGESLGEHDFFFDHGDYVYNATLRVPLGLVPPETDSSSRSRVVDDWVSLVDVTPTLVELLDLQVSDDVKRGFRGRSLAPYLEGRSLPPRPLFAECGMSFYPEMIKRRVRFDVAGRFRSAIQGQWKLIWAPFQTDDLAYELYDLENDPHETRNLYHPSHPAATELRPLLETWMASDTMISPTEEISDEDLERLRSLGYVDN